jgi:hypothetical protein
VPRSPAVRHTGPDCESVVRPTVREKHAPRANGPSAQPGRPRDVQSHAPTERTGGCVFIALKVRVQPGPVAYRARADVAQSVVRRRNR